MTLNAGAGGDTIAADDVGGAKYQRVKLALGADGTAADAPVGGGTEAGVLRVTLASDSTGVVSVDDNGASLTIDAPVGTPAFVRLSDGSAAITTLPVSLASVPSHDVTNAGTFATQATLSAETTKVIGTVNISAAQTIAAVTAISNALPAGNNNIGDVDVASSALPSGASTSANQTTIIGHLDGVEGSLTTIAGAIKAEDAVHASGDVGIMALAVRQNSQVDLGADGDYIPFTIDDTGGVRVSVVSGGITAAVHDAAANGDGVQLMGVASATPPTSVTTGDAVRLWATLDGAQVTAGQIVDDAAFGVATTRVVPVGLLADETATDSVDEGDAGVPRMTLDRKQIVTNYAHAPAGGWTPHVNLDVDETEDDIKTSAGKLGWIHVINRSTGVRYIKFYNATAANVTVGTTTPVLSFPVPTMADTNGAGFCINFGDVGTQFDTALSVAATTGVAHNDTGAPGTNDIVLNCGYL